MTPETLAELSKNVHADKTFTITRIIFGHKNPNAKALMEVGELHLQHPNKKQEVKDMADINLDGKAPEGITEKVKLEDKSRHTAELKNCRVQEVSDYDNPSKKVNRLILDWNIDDKTLPMWANPKISKGSGSFSNSKLYDVFTTLNVLDDFAKKFKGKTQITDEELSEYIKSLAGTKAEVQIRNVKTGKEDEYSNVGDVVKLVK